MSATTTRERLIEAGTDLFYQHGFQAMGLDRILDEVGITKTAFYKHFDSKDELIVAVLNHRDAIDIEEWTRFVASRAGDDPRGQLLAGFDQLHVWFQEPDFRGCMFQNAVTEFPSPSDPIHLAAEAHSVRLTKVLVGYARRAGAPDSGALAEQLMMLIRGAIMQRHAGGDLNAAKKARVAAEAVIEAACPATP